MLFKRFTLIEILVAITILAILSILIMQVFHTGLQSYKKSYGKNRTQIEARGAAEYFRSDVKKIIAGSKFNCQNNRFAFSILDKEKQEIQRVTWNFIDGKLTRSAKNLKNPEKKEFFDLIKKCNGQFSYLFQGKWQDTVEPQKTPQMVKLVSTVNYEDNKENLKTELSLPWKKLPEQNVVEGDYEE